MVVFCVHVAMGGVLTSGTVFSTLTLVNLLQYTMTKIFPMGIMVSMFDRGFYSLIFEYFTSCILHFSRHANIQLILLLSRCQSATFPVDGYNNFSKYLSLKAHHHNQQVNIMIADLSFPCQT